MRFPSFCAVGTMWGKWGSRVGVLLDWGGLTDWGGGREVGSGFQLAAGAHMAKGGVGGAFGLWPKVGACMAKRAFGHPPTYGRAAPLAMRWPKRPPFAGHHKTKSGRGGPSMGQRAPTPPLFRCGKRSIVEKVWKNMGKTYAFMCVSLPHGLAIATASSRSGSRGDGVENASQNLVHLGSGWETSGLFTGR